MIKLHSFINTFHQLWKAGETAHLDLNTHAGQAWIGIRTPLGYYSQTHPHNHNVPQTHHTHTQNPPHTPQTPTHQQHHTHTKRSPSYFRRLQCRKTDREANSTTTNTNSAEKAELTQTLAEQANQTRKLTAQFHHNSAEQVEHITTPAEKAATTTLPAEQADKTTASAEQAGNNTIDNNISTKKVDHSHQQIATPTTEIEHTKAYTKNSSTPNTNTTTHNTPEVTDDDIRIRYKKFTNVLQRPLNADDIAFFKRHCPNPTEEDIIQTSKLYINLRIQKTQQLQQELSDQGINTTLTQLTKALTKQDNEKLIKAIAQTTINIRSTTPHQ